MTIWPPHPAELQRPAYRALAERLVRAIDLGELEPGDRLPPHRSLAEQLGLSVQTVTRALELVAQRGLVQGETGRGTFVRDSIGEQEQPFTDERSSELIDLSMLKPVALPTQMDRLRQSLANLDLTASSMYSFRPSVALDRQRESATDWLRNCGVKAQAANIMLTNGATPGMTVALMTACGPGQKLASEAIGHHTLAPLARFLGLEIAPIEIDEQGIIPEALDQACRKNSDLQAVYLLPNGAGPTAAVMDRVRRDEVVTVARTHDLQIIENDALAPLIQPDGPPLAMLAPERSFYISTLTKAVLPGLRIGFLVVPDRFVAAAANRQLAANWMATPLMADLAAMWIDNGTAFEFATAQRAALRQRQRLASEMLHGIECRYHVNGAHLWLPMPGEWRAEDMVSQSRLLGVAVAPGSAFALTPDIAVNAVRLCTGGVDQHRLEHGLRIISRLLHGAAEPALLAN